MTMADHIAYGPNARMSSGHKELTATMRRVRVQYRETGPRLLRMDYGVGERVHHGSLLHPRFYLWPLSGTVDDRFWMVQRTIVISTIDSLCAGRVFGHSHWETKR